MKILYSADWSEYFGYQPADGTGDVYFHLDSLWASANIDAIGIDVYWPLADWRDGSSHLDRIAGTRSVYALDYLKGNLTGGEGFDWYYASDAARRSQTRTAITDGAGKPWAFRYKDLKSWWSNAHKNRPGGIESLSSTAWIPQSKPVWLMEVGCGAVDKAANQPNVFVDPKSSETALPYFSTGRRDDYMQRRYLQAILEAFDPASPGAVAGLNPVSSVYGGRMVDVSRTHVYAWDLRPFPAFPADTDTWSDGASWRFGHWLNGRVTSVSLDGLIAQMAADYGFDMVDASGLEGLVPGYAIDRIMALRDVLQPLELAYFLDSLESGGSIVLRARGSAETIASLIEDDLVEEKAGAPRIAVTRAQETDLPASAKISFISSEGDYRQAVVEARRLAGASARVSQADLPLVLDPDAAGELAESWLFDAWASREHSTFVLPPSRLAAEPGDVVLVDAGGRQRALRITEVGDHGARAISARSLDPEVFTRASLPSRPADLPAPVASGPPEVLFLDLPLLTGEEPATAGYIAAAQSPWPGPMAIYRSPETTGFTLQGFVNVAAAIGLTLNVLPPGPEGRIDRASRLRVQLTSGASAASVSRLKMLSGSNTAAVQCASGAWEVIQFETATLVAADTYELSNLLRGQSGTEGAMAAVTSGSRSAISCCSGLASPASILRRARLVCPSAGGSVPRPATSARIAMSPQPTPSLASANGRSAPCSCGDHEPPATCRSRGYDAPASAATVGTRGEVPVSESSEAYEVDILAGTTVKRTLASSTPGAIYTAAQQVSDFGAPQAAVSVRVYQISATWGRGAPRAATI